MVNYSGSLLLIATVATTACARLERTPGHRLAARRFVQEPRSLASNVVANASSVIDKRADTDSIFAQIAQVAKLALAAPVVSTVDTTATDAANAAAQAEAEQQKQEEQARAAAAKKLARLAATERRKAAAEKKAAAEAAAAKKAAEAKKAADEAAAAKKAAEDKAAADKAAADKAAADKAAQEAAEAKKAQDEKDAAAAAAEKKQSVKLANVSHAKGKGLFGVSDSRCGASDASDEEPNGSLSFLNCGISKNNRDSGWTPPMSVTLSSLKVVTPEQALAMEPQTWAACEQYFWIFEKAERETGVPAIMMASFALQESSCNANTRGGGGEYGLCQITKDKCEGRSDEECLDPEFNVMKAASFFKSTLDGFNGALLPALGAYNGWYPGLSYNGATNAAYGDCCKCQNNLDYLTQVLNGWILGRPGWKLGSYKNLAVCN